MRKMIATAVAALWFGSAFAEFTPLNDGWILNVSEDVFDGTVTKFAIKPNSAGDDSFLRIGCDNDPFGIITTDDYFSTTSSLDLESQTRIDDEPVTGWTWFGVGRILIPSPSQQSKLREGILESEKLAVRVSDYETTTYVFDLTGIQDAVAALEC